MKIPVALTSHNQLGKTGRKTGVWLDAGVEPRVKQDQEAQKQASSTVAAKALLELLAARKAA
jgi:hypothetical protein